MFDHRLSGHEHQRHPDDRSDRGDDAIGVPGKRTLTERLFAYDDAAAPPQTRARPGASAAAPASRSLASLFGSHLAPRSDALPAELHDSMGRSFDADFSGVRIHQGSEAARVGARAYAHGTDLHFAPGQYDPHSLAGRELIGHELAHVVQQSSGRVPAMIQMKALGVALNDDRVLEHEADRAGARAARGEPSGLSGGGRVMTGGHAAVQLDVSTVLIAIAAAVDIAAVTAAVAAESLAAYFNVSTTTVYSVAAIGGIGVSAAVAMFQRYKRGELQEDPDNAALAVHVPEIAGLLAAATPYTRIVGQLTTREWYKADTLSWARKLKLFRLVANRTGDAAQRTLLAQTVDALATHAAADAAGALTALGLALPAPVAPDGAAPAAKPEPDEIDQAPAAVKNQLKQVAAEMGKAKKLKQFHQLDNIEQRIIAWFGRYKNDVQHAQRQAMFTALDEIQALHKQLTAHQIDNHLELWLPDNLGADEDRANIQAIWHAIVAGDAQFTFDQPVDKSFGKDVAVPAEVTRQIKVEVISQLGRLMSQPAGRKLIGTFFKTDEASVVNFRLAQLYRIVAEGYVGDSAVARNDDELSLSSAPHVATGQRATKGRKVERGRGQASDVMVTPNKQDSLFLDYDANYDRILSPGYIGLGHELVHAAHNKTGVSLGDWTLDGMPPEFHDLEEFVTIAPRATLETYRKHKVTGGAHKPAGGTTPTTTTFGELLDLIGNIPNEADLRKEHNLDERHEHISSLSDHTTGHALPRKADVSTMVKTSLPDALQQLTI